MTEKLYEIVKDYQYDHAGRLKTVTQDIGDGNGAITIAENTYNEIGQLIETDLHGGLETRNYAYNIRGWLTAIDGQQFSQKLLYQNTVSGLTQSGANNAFVPQWSGNISATEWQAPAVNTDWHAHWFKYDNLSRLTWTNYKRKGSNYSSDVYSSNAGTSKFDYYVVHGIQS